MTQPRSSVPASREGGARSARAPGPERSGPVWAGAQDGALPHRLCRARPRFAPSVRTGLAFWAPHPPQAQQAPRRGRGCESTGTRIPPARGSHRHEDPAAAAVCLLREPPLRTGGLCGSWGRTVPVPAPPGSSGASQRRSQLMAAPRVPGHPLGLLWKQGLQFVTLPPSPASA